MTRTPKAKPAQETVPVDAAPVEAPADAPEAMPQEISDKVPGLTLAGEESRIDIWLSETRYLISQLEHDHAGQRGEIVAYLKSRL